MGAKPDRLVTLVEKAARQVVSDLIPGDNKNPEDYALTQRTILALLRREQEAQRARVVKLVKDELAYRIKRHRDPSEDVSGMAACKSILAKLHGRTP